MISDKAANLTGKTISARYDPWGEPEFDQHIDQIAASPLYTTQRIFRNMPNSTLARRLALAAERKRKRFAATTRRNRSHVPNRLL